MEVGNIKYHIQELKREYGYLLHLTIQENDSANVSNSYSRMKSTCSSRKKK